MQRGVQYLTVDASPMSRPILERLGFQLVAISNPCNWHVNREQESETLQTGTEGDTNPLG